MMLSSTMSTLIGGTVPSRRLVAAGKGLLLLTFFLDFRGFCDGRGEDTRGGGVRTDFGVCSGVGAGGVDEPGGGGAEAPLRGRFAGSVMFAEGDVVMMVGEDVCWRGYFGRCC
jgi:hypothetical protein